MKNHLPLAEARRWALEGVPVRDAIKARDVGLSLAELRRWQKAGFNSADAWEAKETGVGIPEAMAWREAGFVPRSTGRRTWEGPASRHT